jgi:hypothetical protein
MAGSQKVGVRLDSTALELTKLLHAANSNPEDAVDVDDLVEFIKSREQVKKSISEVIFAGLYLVFFTVLVVYTVDSQTARYSESPLRDVGDAAVEAITSKDTWYKYIETVFIPTFNGVADYNDQVLDSHRSGGSFSEFFDVVGGITLKATKPKAMKPCFSQFSYPGCADTASGVDENEIYIDLEETKAWMSKWKKDPATIMAWLSATTVANACNEAAPEVNGTSGSYASYSDIYDPNVPFPSGNGSASGWNGSAAGRRLGGADTGGNDDAASARGLFAGASRRKLGKAKKSAGSGPTSEGAADDDDSADLQDASETRSVVNPITALSARAVAAKLHQKTTKVLKCAQPPVSALPAAGAVPAPAPKRSFLQRTTSQVEHAVVTFNGEYGKFNLLQMVVRFPRNGKAKTSVFVGSVEASQMESWMWVLWTIYAVHMIQMLLGEIRELRNQGYKVYCKVRTRAVREPLERAVREPLEGTR